MAEAKIKAIYSRSRDIYDNTKSSPSEMMDKIASILSNLGKTVIIEDDDVVKVSNMLADYICPPTSIQYSSSKRQIWPFVEAARVFCKAKILSTGIGLVDLPGMQSSNAAFTSVANNFMKHCNGALLVSEASNFVKDQATARLVEQAIGVTSNHTGSIPWITIACSKTDDININDVASFLGEDINRPDIISTCVEGRNQYLKNTLQQDFGPRFHELCAKKAAERGSGNTNAVEKSLPVFCVSVRGYRQLRKFDPNDRSECKFSDIDQTEIHQLLDHCKQLTGIGKAERTKACIQFLVGLEKLATPLSESVVSDESSKSRGEPLGDLQARMSKIVEEICQEPRGMQGQGDQRQ